MPCCKSLIFMAKQAAPNRGVRLGTRTGQWGRSWAGRKAHMGYSQEAYDAECAAIARPSGGSGEGQATKAQQSPYLHRCTSRDHGVGAWRARPGPDLRPSGEEGDSRPCASGSLLSRLRSAGAPRTKGSTGTRSWTDRPSGPPANQVTTGSSGWRMYSNGVRRPLPPTFLAHLKRT